MRYRSLFFETDGTGALQLRDIGEAIPKFYNNITVAIDGSSTCTGISYIDSSTASILGTTAVWRDTDKKGKATEDFVEYKVKLKRLLKQLFDNNLSLVKNIDYEEPFIGYTEASKVLMSIRTSVRELIVENEPAYDYSKYTEINNQKWKRLFLAPNKVPDGTEAQKKAVRDKMIAAIPQFKDLTQDEIDASGMGYVATKFRNEFGGDAGLQTKKAVRPFKYNIRFIGVDDEGQAAEDIMLQELVDAVEEWKVPKKVIENGAKIVDLNGHGLFDKHVYNNMGDEDKLLILGYKSDKYVNKIIEANMGWMVSNFQTLYAVIWRISRK